MPRKPRFFLPGVPVHVVQRGHSREAVFYEDDDCRAPNSHRSFDQISGRRKLKIYDCFTTFSS